MPHGTKFFFFCCQLSYSVFFGEIFFFCISFFLYAFFVSPYVCYTFFLVNYMQGDVGEGYSGIEHTPFYKCPLSLPTKLCRGAVILFFCHLGGGGGWGSNPTPTSNSQHFFSVKAQHYFFVNYVCYTFGLVLYHLGLLVFSYWARLFSFNCFGFRIFVKFNFYQGQIFDQKNLLDNFS